jgi:hypothetical protein
MIIKVDLSDSGSQRLSGWRFLTGLLRFQLTCAVGAISNVGAAAWLYDYQQNWWARRPRRFVWRSR